MMKEKQLPRDFFAKDAAQVAVNLLGKVLRVYYQHHWLAAKIIETEAYYIHEKGSHASLGYTEKRKALFMPPGTIYMYYARGGDSLNFSCLGAGNAVLIKSAIPYVDTEVLAIMQALNPIKNTRKMRCIDRLCSGQTLLCKSLNLKVKEWDQKQLTDTFNCVDIGYTPKIIVKTTRLGIPIGRDEHLPLRFIDKHYLKHCTKKPMKRDLVEEIDLL